MPTSPSLPKPYGIRIRKRSHHVLITHFNEGAKKVINKFAYSLIQWGRFRKGNYTVKTPMKVFASATRSRDEYRFHINYYQDLLRELRLAGYTPEKEDNSKRILIEEEPFADSADIETVKIKDSFVPRPDQVGALAYIADVTPKSRAKLLSLQTGGGKAQPLDEPVLTPYGFKEIGLLVVGDKVISATSGKSTTVKEVHRQGLKDVFLITLEDERQVRCCVDHLWYAQYQDEPFRVVPFHDLLDDPTNWRLPIYNDSVKSLAISRIEYVDLLPSICITIEDPSALYVTANNVITHNSLTAMMAAEAKGKRNIYLMRPAFIENWIKNFKKTYEEELAGCVLIQGRKQLQALLQLAVDGDLHYDNIVISNKTFQYWLKDYEDYGEKMIELGWPATPDKFTELLGAGILTLDELHLDFHLNFKIMLYAHVPVSVAMTATLETRDPFLAAIYERVQPVRERYGSAKLNQYIDAFAYFYQYENPAGIQTTEYGNDDYSHNAYERWIMRDKDRLTSYFEMIESLLKVDYLDVRSPGESALVFCSSIKMCQLLAAWLQKRHPKEVVDYFISGGDYTENFLKASIVVSTVGKSGTAVDKEGLRTAILTISLDSIAGNLQTLGRLRVMPSGNTPRFIYLVCNDVEKHLKYHKNKMELLPQYVKALRVRRHGKPL